jgi:hypothetical protein
MPKYTEQMVWTCALIVLYFMNSSSSGGSLCVFRFFGIGSCPGCGLGHAIYYALHLDFIRSFQHHILGIPVTIGILIQIFKPFCKHTNIKLT